MTDLLTYEFDKTSIQFLITNDVMVNATQMGLVYKKNPADFLKTKNAIELIEALKRRALGQKKNITEEQIASGIEFLEGEILSIARI